MDWQLEFKWLLNWLLYTVKAKKQQQRIIVFAGSPVKYEKKPLELIGHKLKKNSVALDVVDFGEDVEGKSEKLEAFVVVVNNNETSHYVHVPPASNALSDVPIRYKKNSMYNIFYDVSESQLPGFEKAIWLEWFGCFQMKNEIIFVPNESYQ